MRVVRPGNRDSVWPRGFECPHCTALLELVVEDIKRNTDYTGDFTSWYIDCPECNEQPDVPKDWWNVIHRMKNNQRTPPPSDYRSCPSHCCVPHGCKYGYDECPVSTEKIKPDSETQCELCWNEKHGVIW